MRDLRVRLLRDVRLRLLRDVRVFNFCSGLSDGFPDCESELYEIYLDAVTEMPMANLEKFSNPVLWWEVTLFGSIIINHVS